MGKTAFIVAFAGAVLLAPAARAAGPEPEMASNRGGADVYWWSAKTVGSSFGLVPFLRYGLTSELYLDLWAPVGANMSGPDDKSRFGLGNPTLGLHYATTSGFTTFFVGGRLSLPLIKLLDDNTQSIADSYAAATMTLYDSHYWTRYLPVAAFLGLEHRASEVVYLRAQLDPGFWLGLQTGDKVEFIYQGRAEIEARADSGWGGGGGLQIFHAPGLDGDNAQAAMEGFGSFDNGSLFARLGLLLALDEPLGFGFDKGKVATLHFRIGGYL
jgi:hypothetical protein